MLAEQMKASATARWADSQGMWPFGAKSPREFLAKMLESAENVTKKCSGSQRQLFAP
jgi:hypothetical protein